MMPSSIAYTKNYTSILDAVYQRASASGILTSGRRMVRAGRHAREIMIPKIEVSGLGDYTHNVGHKTGSKQSTLDGMRLFSVERDSEVVELSLKAVLRRQAGVGEEPLFMAPFGEPPVVEGLHVVGDDERHHAVGEAFFEHDESSDATVPVLEWVDPLEADMKVDDGLE